jgi:hypothetical protein
MDATGFVLVGLPFWCSRQWRVTVPAADRHSQQGRHTACVSQCPGKQCMMLTTWISSKGTSTGLQDSANSTLLATRAHLTPLSSKYRKKMQPMQPAAKSTPLDHRSVLKPQVHLTVVPLV